MPMAKNLQESSLAVLFENLHNLMINLVRDVDSVIEDNKGVSIDDVRELRDHISHRLSKNEEIADNGKLLKVLNLFSEDKAVIEIIREDAEEWIDLLDSIEGNIRGSGGSLTKKEQEEIRQINKLTKEIKGLIRKS
jgi:hypothetical protein